MSSPRILPGALLALVGFLGVASVRAQSWTVLNHQPGVPIQLCLLLTDGGVICQSGPDWYKLTPDLTGSYLNGTWSQIASFPAGYEPHVYSPAVLADGRVVVVGGEYNSSGQIVLSNKGAVYDPVTNTWTSLAPPAGWDYIGDAPATVLPNGQFLIGSKLDARMAVLDPATLIWSAVNSTGKGDSFNSEENWILLPDGSVLAIDVKNAPNTERFLPTTSTWVTAGSTPVDTHSPPGEGPITLAAGVVYTPPGDMGPAMLLPDGRVFAEGGNGHNAIYTPPPANSSAPGTWVQAPDFPGGLYVDDGPAAVLPNGHVLAATSPPDDRLGLSFYEFDGANLIPVPANPNASGDASNFTSLLLLPTGEVLLVDSSSSVQLYTAAGTYNPSWAPTISSVPATLVNGSTYPISGTQFNGLSQGSAFGDENQNSTNYPLVRITNNASGHVAYARTHGHSSMGVATGSTPASTNFDVPANTELGASTLAVVANGIPSTPVSVSITSVNPPPVTLTCPAASNLMGTAYSSALVASGGQPPFTFSILNGSLPSNLILTLGTGAIAGTPNVVGASTFTAKVADSASGSTTANCTITITPPPAGGFQGKDAATEGNWKGVYGTDGYIIANDSSNLPTYATVNVAGASTWTWIQSTTDTRALLKGTSSSDRIASTFYSGTNFTFDVNLTGGQHQVALYVLDLDTFTRAQTISIIDANTNAILDTEYFSSFRNGVYAVWNLQGHVLVKVVCDGGLNAVISGLFFAPTSGSGGGGGGTPNPPSISITAPSAGSVSGTITVTATATAAAGMASVQFQLDGTNLGAPVTGTGPAFSTPWITASSSDGSHSLTAIAADNLGQHTTSSMVAVNVSSGGSSGSTGPAATFVKFDAATEGTWKGVYGQDGYVIANDSSGLPNYAAVSANAASLWTWAGSSSDPRSTQKGASSTDRIASTYYSGTTFTFDVNLSDSQSHQVAVYALDFDSFTRSETISILDAATNVVLDSESILNFHNGEWVVWNLRGHVLIQVANAGGLNGVVSGLFFGTPGGGGGGGGSTLPSPPTVGIMAPAAGSVSGNVALSANASSTAGIASVQFVLDGSTNLGDPILAAPYTYLWNSSTASNGPHVLTAIATDTLSQPTTSAGVSITVTNSAPAGASATFVKKDAVTEGAWKTHYGTDGAMIANDVSSPPAYVSATFNGAAQFTWTITQDPRALQQTAGNARTASTFYATPGFSVDLNLTDGAAHQVAFYFLDWDSGGRAESVRIVDAATQQVLDTQTISSFVQGAYLVWNVKGHVTVQFQLTAGANAVVSGAFFGP
jgi:hypothetical protein